MKHRNRKRRRRARIRRRVKDRGNRKNHGNPKGIKSLKNRNHRKRIGINRLGASRRSTNGINRNHALGTRIAMPNQNEFGNVNALDHHPCTLVPGLRHIAVDVDHLHHDLLTPDIDIHGMHCNTMNAIMNTSFWSENDFIQSLSQFDSKFQYDIIDRFTLCPLLVGGGFCCVPLLIVPLFQGELRIKSDAMKYSEVTTNATVRGTKLQ